jgi:hypothetical protein
VPAKKKKKKKTHKDFLLYRPHLSHREYSHHFIVQFYLLVVYFLMTYIDLIWTDGLMFEIRHLGTSYFVLRLFLELFTIFHHLFTHRIAYSNQPSILNKNICRQDTHKHWCEPHKLKHLTFCLTYILERIIKLSLTLTRNRWMKHHHSFSIYLQILFSSFQMGNNSKNVLQWLFFSVFFILKLIFYKGLLDLACLHCRKFWVQNKTKQ